MKKRTTNAELIKEYLSDALVILMKIEPYEEINVKEICYKAGIGRTSYYRYFDNKNGKRNLILHKIFRGWEEYCKPRQELVKKDSTLVLLSYFYDNRELFELLKNNGLLSSILSELFFTVFDPRLSENKKLAYGNAFLAGGFYGTTYWWIENGYPESPQELYKICSEQTNN